MKKQKLLELLVRVVLFGRPHLQGLSILAFVSVTMKIAVSRIGNHKFIFLTEFCSCTLDAYGVIFSILDDL